MVQQFNAWLHDTDHMKMFLRVFPVVATTCISAYKLSCPSPIFDMVILDEASQCNTAVSLVPIIRGRSLMLVGDPQQLQPAFHIGNSRVSDVSAQPFIHLLFSFSELFFRIGKGHIEVFRLETDGLPDAVEICA